jgi:hypothetical protein
MNEPSPERRQWWAWGASMFERLLGYNGLKAAREDRPPVDSTIARREKMWATVMALVLVVPCVLFAVQVEVTLAKIVCFVWAAVCLVWTARNENESSKRRKR